MIVIANVTTVVFVVVLFSGRDRGCVHDRGVVVVVIVVMIVAWSLSWSWSWSWRGRRIGRCRIRNRVDVIMTLVVDCGRG